MVIGRKASSCRREKKKGKENGINRVNSGKARELCSMKAKKWEVS